MSPMHVTLKAGVRQSIINNEIAQCQESFDAPFFNVTVKLAQKREGTYPRNYIGKIDPDIFE